MPVRVVYMAKLLDVKNVPTRYLVNGLKKIGPELQKQEEDGRKRTEKNIGLSNSSASSNVNIISPLRNTKH